MHSNPAHVHSGILTMLYRLYVRAMQIMAVVAMALIVITLATQVVYRYFLSGSLIWAEELSRCLLVWLCFLFAGIAYQRGEMAAVDSLVYTISPSWRAMVMLPALAGALLFVALLIYYSTIYAGQNWFQILPGVTVLWRNITGSASGFSIFWVYISIPIGLSILFLHICGTALRLLLLPHDLYVKSQGPTS